MVDRVERVTTVTSPETTARPVNREVREVVHEPGENVAARVIWYVAGVLLVLLAFRFVFALLGANPNNGFANFIYTVSHPFVAPFFSLFGYNLRYGISRFETYTLVAMAVYAVIAWGLARLVTLNRPPRTA
jgi:hypothetical protein